MVLLRSVMAVGEDHALGLGKILVDAADVNGILVHKVMVIT